MRSPSPLKNDCRQMQYVQLDRLYCVRGNSGDGREPQPVVQQEHKDCPTEPVQGGVPRDRIIRTKYPRVRTQHGNASLAIEDLQCPVRVRTTFQHSSQVLEKDGRIQELLKKASTLGKHIRQVCEAMLKP